MRELQTNSQRTAETEIQTQTESVRKREGKIEGGKPFKGGRERERERE